MKGCDQCTSEVEKENNCLRCDKMHVLQDGKCIDCSSPDVNYESCRVEGKIMPYELIPQEEKFTDIDNKITLTLNMPIK